jgi:hypothetical protein
MTRECAKLAGRIRQGKEKSQGEKAPDEGLAEVLAADFTDGNLCINQAAKAPLRHVMTPKLFREKCPRASGSDVARPSRPRDVPFSRLAVGPDHGFELFCFGFAAFAFCPDSSGFTHCVGAGAVPALGVDGNCLGSHTCRFIPRCRLSRSQRFGLKEPLQSLVYFRCERDFRLVFGLLNCYVKVVTLARVRKALGTRLSGIAWSELVSESRG